MTLKCHKNTLKIAQTAIVLMLLMLSLMPIMAHAKNVDFYSYMANKNKGYSINQIDQFSIFYTCQKAA